MAVQTVVSQIVDEIALRIVSGDYKAGEHLPSVRKLAAEFDVNPSTAQSVLGRLETLGFANARQASGFVVKDIDLYGGLSTWRYIFKFAQKNPERAISMCEELLDMRAILIIEAFKRVHKNPGKYSTRSIHKAMERFEHLAETDPDNYVEISKAQIHVMRCLYQATEQTVLKSVINSITEVYFEMPAFMQIMTKSPKVNIVFWNNFLQEWDNKTLTQEKIDRAEALVHMQNQAMLTYFREALSR